MFRGLRDLLSKWVETTKDSQTVEPLDQKVDEEPEVQLCTYPRVTKIVGSVLYDTANAHRIAVTTRAVMVQYVPYVARRSPHWALYKTEKGNYFEVYYFDGFPLVSLSREQAIDAVRNRMPVEEAKAILEQHFNLKIEDA